MVRPTEQETIVIEVCYSVIQFPRGGDIQCHREPYREAPVLVKRQRKVGGGELWVRVFTVDSTEGDPK